MISLNTLILPRVRGGGSGVAVIHAWYPLGHNVRRVTTERVWKTRGRARKTRELVPVSRVLLVINILNLPEMITNMLIVKNCSVARARVAVHPGELGYSRGCDEH